MSTSFVIVKPQNRDNQFRFDTSFDSVACRRVASAAGGDVAERRDCYGYR